MKKGSFQINIPSPCSQDWNSMKKNGTGKLCTQCNNIVYDFSEMQDDALLDFFRQRPDVHCGRFHSSQLNRNILPAKKATFSLERCRKIAVTILAILSFKTGNLKAEKNEKHSLVFDSNFKKAEITLDEKVTITGQVKDASGNPLENVSVRFDNGPMVLTGKDGRFSFELENISAVNHVIDFNIAGYVRTVRSYHIVMKSTHYDVTLNKEGESSGFHTMGIILPERLDKGELPTLTFEGSSTVISGNNKTKLDRLAVKLLDNPFVQINLAVFNNAVPARITLALKRAKAVKAYLVNNKGISSDRIYIREMEEKGDARIISIFNQYQY